jgi:peptidoglycan/LPS O-acetylase OafA/YrhL
MSQDGARPVVVDQPPTRRDELDLLRALVVVGLVFFHTAVIFGAGEFPVKAATENRVATVFLGFGAAWGMPLLFLISGMGIWYSLRSRGAGAFARERLRRLGVPLLVGLLTLVPLQVYLGLRRAGDPSSLSVSGLLVNGSQLVVAGSSLVAGRGGPSWGQGGAA